MICERSLKYVFHVLSRCPKGGTNSARIHIPETLFYEHGTLQHWYRYDPDTREIVRKDRRECNHELIYDALGLEGKGVGAQLRASAVSTMLAGGYNVHFPDVPIAVVLSGKFIVPGFVPGDPRALPENGRLRRDARRRARAGQGAIRKHNIPLELIHDDAESSVDSDDSRGGVSQPKLLIAETFLDRSGIDSFLNGNELKHHALLQKYPLGRSLHATVVEAVYSPQVTYVTQRQNRRFLSDTAVSLYERCCTSESNPHLVEQIQISRRARELVQEACVTIVEHIMAVESRCVARMVAYFSFEASDQGAGGGDEQSSGGATVYPLLLWVPELHLSREVPREAVRRTLTTFTERKLVTMQPETLPGLPIGPGQRKKRQDYLAEREKYLPYAARVGSPSVMALNGRGGTDRILASVSDQRYNHLCESYSQYRTSQQRQRYHSPKTSVGGNNNNNNNNDSLMSRQHGGGVGAGTVGRRLDWAGSPFAHLLRDANPDDHSSSEDKIRRIVAASSMTAKTKSQLLLLKGSPNNNNNNSSSSSSSPAMAMMMMMNSTRQQPQRATTPAVMGSGRKAAMALAPLPNSHAAFSSPSSMLSPSRVVRLMKQKQQQQFEKIYDPATGQVIDLTKKRKKRASSSSGASGEGNATSNNGDDKTSGDVPCTLNSAELSLLRFDKLPDVGGSSGSSDLSFSSSPSSSKNLHGSSPENSIPQKNNNSNNNNNNSPNNNTRAGCPDSDEDDDGLFSAGPNDGNSADKPTRPGSAAATDTARRRSGAGNNNSSSSDHRTQKRRDSQSAELQAALAAARAQMADRHGSSGSLKSRAKGSPSPKRRKSRYELDALPIDADMFSSLSGLRLHAKSKQLIDSPHAPVWLRCLSPEVNLYLHKELSALDAAVEWLTHLSYLFDNAARRAEEEQRATLIGPSSGTSASSVDKKKLPDVRVAIEIAPFPPPPAVRKCPLTVQEILIGPPKIYLFSCWRMILFPGPAQERVLRLPFSTAFGGRGGRGKNSTKQRSGSVGGGSSSPENRKLASARGVIEAMALSTTGSPLFSRRGSAAAGLQQQQPNNNSNSSLYPESSGVLNAAGTAVAAANAVAAMEGGNGSTKRKRARRPGSLVTQALLQEESYVVPYAVESNTIQQHLGSAIGRENQSVSVNIDPSILTSIEEVRTQSRLLDTPVMSLSAAQMISTPYMTTKFAVFTPRANNYVVPTPPGTSVVVTCPSIRDCKARADSIRQLARIAATTKRFILFETIGIALRKAASFSKKMHQNAITADAQLAGNNPLESKQKRSSAFMAAAVRLFRDDQTVRSKELELAREAKAEAEAMARAKRLRELQKMLQQQEEQLAMMQQSGSASSGAVGMDEKTLSEEIATTLRRIREEASSSVMQSANIISSSSNTTCNNNINNGDETDAPDQRQLQAPLSVHTDPGRMIRRFFSEVPCALSAPATWGQDLIDLQLRFSGVASPQQQSLAKGESNFDLFNTSGSNTSSNNANARVGGAAAAAASGVPNVRDGVFIPASPHEVSPIARQLQAACEKFTGHLKREVIWMLRVACMPNYLADVPPDVSEELLLLDATSKMKRPTTRSRLTPDQQQQMFMAAMKAISAEGDMIKAKRQNPALEPVNAAVEDWPPRLVLRSEGIPEGLC